MSDQVQAVSTKETPLFTVPNIRLCKVNDANKITELVNEAFMKDAFFKHRTHFLRMKEDGSTALSILKSTRSIFLAYECSDKCELLGCIKIDLDPRYVTEVTEERKSKESITELDLNSTDGNYNIYNTSFGMLSVPEKNSGGGIGSMLLKAMEEYVTKMAKIVGKRKVQISMPLISLRSDLLKFYEKRGYSFWKETNLDEGDTEMVLQKYMEKIKFLWYHKIIETQCSLD